jgi:hypothetical protein
MIKPRRMSAIAATVALLQSRNPAARTRYKGARLWFCKGGSNQKQIA